jgi:hypothetical protein
MKDLEIPRFFFFELFAHIKNRVKQVERSISTYSYYDHETMNAVINIDMNKFIAG